MKNTMMMDVQIYFKSCVDTPSFRFDFSSRCFRSFSRDFKILNVNCIFVSNLSIN